MRDPSNASSGLLGWKWEEGVTMHPFWAVRRFTKEQLDNEQAQMDKRDKGQTKEWKLLNFNCSFVIRQFSVCHVGTFQSSSVSETLFVDVPLMTNNVAIEKGQELLLEIEKKAPANKRKQSTWREELQKPPKAKPPQKSQAEKKKKTSAQEI